jgi:pyruvate,orthophosphate dikinase
MGKCCVAGASEIAVDEKAKTLIIGGKTYNEGDMITLDGSTGEVFAGALKVVDPELSGDFGTLMSWADKYRTM